MTPQTIRQWLCGPMVAVATPFKEDLSLDLDALRQNVRFMVQRGVTTGSGSLLVGGAGGEHPVLNVEERKAVMDAALDAAEGQVPVLTSIQHTDVRVVTELARHASRAGLQGVQLGPTYYYTPSEGDVLRLFKTVARESDVPLMVYHTWWAGFTMSVNFVKRLAEIDTVRALKWSAPNGQLFAEGITAMAGQLVVIDNQGEHVWSHILGTRGFITHLSGFWPEYPAEIWRLLEKREYVAAKERLAAFKWRWAEWRSKVGKVTGGEGPFIKAAMEVVGLKAGPPRPPSVRPPRELVDELRGLFRDCGVPMAAVSAKR